MKNNIKKVILILTCMHLSVQAMLLNRLQAISQRRSLQRSQARFTFKPQSKSTQISSFNQNNELQSTQKLPHSFDLNKKIDNKLNEQQNTLAGSFYGLLSRWGIIKLSFNEHYRKENRTRYTQEELLKKLEQLNKLSYGKEYSLQENYRHEVDYGDEKQALAWLFGARYKEAARNIRTVTEIELMYEAIIMWFRMQAESGLLVKPEKIKIEFANLGLKESEIINTYDTQSKPILYKYLSDMKNDLYNEFKQWFDTQFSNVKPIQQRRTVNNQEVFTNGNINAAKKNQQQVIE